ELMTHPPSGKPLALPKIQHDFSKDAKDDAHRDSQLQRREAVRNTARKCWETYREYAWGYDELMPIALKGTNTFSGWGATLVDALDTLWIMGLKAEFHDAVQAVGRIDWDRTRSSSASFFETNIRYLGGLLSAFELSGEAVLLEKAKELGHMLYAAFDTPNGLPANSFDFSRAWNGRLVAEKREALVVPGTLSLEFTRLSQLSGDPKYYHQINLITDLMNKTQNDTMLPGLWPTFVDLQDGFKVTEGMFTLGAAADSAYEYLSKMHMLLGGLDPRYEAMHKKAMEAAAKHLLFRPMVDFSYPQSPPDLLFSGTAFVNSRATTLSPEVQHLGCFAGGMFAIGGQLFNLPEHVRIGEQLARGCAWAYRAFPAGIMPESSTIIRCPSKDLEICPWNDEIANEHKTDGIPLPFHRIQDARYVLRPEAIESIFILYRITGNRELQQIAWDMFQSIRKATETKFGHSSILDVRADGQTEKLDSMESFWIAETLKYFYLIFSEPDLISLDDYVFNTEAHPLKRPKP
ncbi:glycoside hydrolase family 47 protein, partial [Thozetella sp. PMI_491]